MSNIVNWNYSDLAAHYDKRAEYSEEAVLDVLKNIGAHPSKPVADIGAGTGKLTKVLAKNGLTVKAVEPNDEMRKFGKENTKNTSVEWSNGTGEETGLSDTSFHVVFFGSSFNVTDREKTLKEVHRILVPNGWFVCMWNHRDLDDKIQKDVELAIKNIIPDYSYGSRREDQTEVINKSNLFSNVHTIEKKFVVSVSKEDYIEAWRSHGTLQRQAGNRFKEVIEAIEKVVGNRDVLEVPYFTRIYYAQLIAEKTDWKSGAYLWASESV